MTDKKSEHLQFIRDTKWEEYVSDPVVSEALDKIEHRVKELKSTGSSSDSENPNAIRVKLVVVGDGAVGKTSLLIRFSTGQFPTEYLPTVFENYTTQMKSDHGPVLLHLWDTAGQEEYDRLRPLSYPRSDVILLCFSLISQVSFESLKSKWWPEVHHYIPSVPYILVGTKADLRDINSPDPNTGKVNLVTKEQATTLAQEIGCVKFMEVSSKEGRGVSEVFNEAIHQVMLHRGVSPKGGSSDSGHSGSSSSGKKPKKEKGCLLL